MAEDGNAGPKYVFVEEIGDAIVLVEARDIANATLRAMAKFLSRQYPFLAARYAPLTTSAPAAFGRKAYTSELRDLINHERIFVVDDEVFGTGEEEDGSLLISRQIEVDLYNPDSCVGIRDEDIERIRSERTHMPILGLCREAVRVMLVRASEIIVQPTVAPIAPNRSDQGRKSSTPGAGERGDKTPPRSNSGNAKRPPAASMKRPGSGGRSKATVGVVVGEPVGETPTPGRKPRSRCPAICFMLLFLLLTAAAVTIFFAVGAPNTGVCVATYSGGTSIYDGSGNYYFALEGCQVTIAPAACGWVCKQKYGYPPGANGFALKSLPLQYNFVTAGAMGTFINTTRSYASDSLIVSPYLPSTTDQDTSPQVYVAVQCSSCAPSGTVGFGAWSFEVASPVYGAPTANSTTVDRLTKEPFEIAYVNLAFTVGYPTRALTNINVSYADNRTARAAALWLGLASVFGLFAVWAVVAFAFETCRPRQAAWVFAFLSMAMIAVGVSYAVLPHSTSLPFLLALYVFAAAGGLVCTGGVIWMLCGGKPYSMK